MGKDPFSLKYEQSETPLKILPKNAWVKICGFKNPCRVIEISMQSITLDITNHPEVKKLQAGQNISLHFLDISGENSLEIMVTIFHIGTAECLCQIPLYINNEQILVDKIILEIQKNEIKEKNFSSSIQNKDTNFLSTEKNFCSIPSDKDMACILNNLVAMLPDETKNNEEDKVTALSLTDIPKSSYEYQAPYNPIKAFETAYDEADDADDDEEFDIEDDEEFYECDDSGETSQPHTLTKSVHPLALLRHSIVNKFLLNNLQDQYPDDTKQLEEINRMEPLPQSKGKTNSTAKKCCKKTKKKKNQPSPEQFLPENLMSEMNSPEFKAGVLSDQYQLYPNGRTPAQDKDAAFEQYYEFSSELPPELVFELANKAKNRKTEYQGLNHKYLTDEYDFTVRDEDDCECFDGDEDCVIGKFDKLLANKRTIEFNVNSDPNYIPKTKEEEDQAFIEKLRTQNNDDKNETAPKTNFNFNIDI